MRTPEPILAIETSCDDTCAAVVTGGSVRSNVVSSQGEIHDRYGGVVPEVASRHHLEYINGVVDRALDEAGIELRDIGAVAVTREPGLIGALLIGLSTAKALAAVARSPLVPVNHLHGHIAACFLDPSPFDPPFLCLIASGGHTLLAAVDDQTGFRTMSATLDDAAGEAFDKGARLLGLGYPGGPALDRLARLGDPASFDFPVGMRGRAEFSFSGVKTALAYKMKALSGSDRLRLAPDLAAAYESAICGQLVDHVDRALDESGLDRLAIVGGVAANSELRRRVLALALRRGAAVCTPPTELCTDNAAMIASAARYVAPVSYPEYLDLDASAQAIAG